MFGGEVLDDAEELLAVAPGHERGLVGGLDGVGVAVADDALGAHGVGDLLDQTGLVHPRRHVEPRGVAVRGRLEVDEADERRTGLVEEGFGEVRAPAVEEDGAVAPLRERGSACAVRARAEYLRVVGVRLGQVRVKGGEQSPDVEQIGRAHV